MYYNNILLLIVLVGVLQVAFVNADNGYTISTFAGDGTSGSSGDGSAATSAKLNKSQGVSVDSFGIVYIADSSNHKIRMVSIS